MLSVSIKVLQDLFTCIIIHVLYDFNTHTQFYQLEGEEKFLLTF